MPTRKTLQLDEDSRAALQHIFKRASDWRQAGMASLADLPRSGAPRKLQPEHVERLVQWAGAEPLTAAALLARHLDAGGPLVHVNTMVATLKASNFVWKRTRHS